MAPLALACLIGSMLALVVAFILSPTSPLGPVHPVLAGAFHLSGAIVLPGCAVLFVVAVGVGVLLAYRIAPSRRLSTTSVSGGSRVARLGATAGLGAAAVA